MTVIFHDPYGREDNLARAVSLAELLRDSDIVSIHVPLTPETRGYIGRRQLRAMKPTATLVNTSRGGVIDEPALVTALREGWIGRPGSTSSCASPTPTRTTRCSRFPTWSCCRTSARRAPRPVSR